MASASSKYLKVGIENALASALGCVLGCGIGRAWSFQRTALPAKQAKPTLKENGTIE